MTFPITNLKRWSPAGLLLACASLSFTTYAMAGEASLDLVCTGNSYKADGPFPTVETFSVKIDGNKPVVIGGPGSDKPVKAHTIASNAVQLKFSTGKYTGEYFNFTGDFSDSLGRAPHQTHLQAFVKASSHSAKIIAPKSAVPRQCDVLLACGVSFLSSLSNSSWRSTSVSHVSAVAAPVASSSSSSAKRSRRVSIIPFERILTSGSIMSRPSLHTRRQA
jgi:hypothetical protein